MAGNAPGPGVPRAGTLAVSGGTAPGPQEPLGGAPRQNTVGADFTEGALELKPLTIGGTTYSVTRSDTKDAHGHTNTYFELRGPRGGMVWLRELRQKPSDASLERAVPGLFTAYRAMGRNAEWLTHAEVGRNTSGTGFPALLVRDGDGLRVVGTRQEWQLRRDMGRERPELAGLVAAYEAAGMRNRVKLALALLAENWRTWDAKALEVTVQAALE